MSNEIPPSSEKKTCPKCSHEQPIEAVFCQKCGTPFPETEKSAESTVSTSGSQWRQVKKRFTQERITPKSKSSSSTAERICPGCNTIIESTVLEQCPLCMSELPPLPPKHKENLDRIFFTGKKIVTEKEIKIDPNKWSSGKEIFNVFLNSMLFYIFITIGAAIFNFQEYIDINLTELLYFVGSIALGIYPLIYIGSNHLHWKKIGFRSDKIVLFILLGIGAGIGLYFVEYGTSLVTNLIPYFHPDSILAYIFDRTALFDLNTVEFPLRIAFYAAFLLEQVSVELLFRGVIHNGIHDLMVKKKRNLSRILPVMLTTLIYAVFYFLFDQSGYALIFNLVLSLVIGIVYELSDRSLSILISMKIIYVGASILFAFIPLF